MESAIERLAAEMMKLPASEWARLVELRHASQQQHAGFWQAEEDELTERLAPREPIRGTRAKQASGEALRSACQVLTKGTE